MPAIILPLVATAAAHVAADNTGSGASSGQGQGQGNDFASLVNKNDQQTTNANQNSGNDKNKPASAPQSPAPRTTQQAANTVKLSVAANKPVKPAAKTDTTSTQPQPAAKDDTRATDSQADAGKAADDLDKELADTLRKVTQLVSNAMQALPAIVPQPIADQANLLPSVPVAAPDDHNSSGAAADLALQLQAMLQQLQQLQQALTQNGAPPATVSTSGAQDSGAQNSQSLLDALQAQLAQLTQQLNSNPATSAPPATTSGNATPDITLPSDNAQTRPVTDTTPLATPDIHVTDVSSQTTTPRPGENVAPVTAPEPKSVKSADNTQPAPPVTTTAPLVVAVPLAPVTQTVKPVSPALVDQVKTTLAQLQTQLQAVKAANSNNPAPVPAATITSTTLTSQNTPAVDPLQALKDALATKGFTLAAPAPTDKTDVQTAYQAPLPVITPPTATDQAPLPAAPPQSPQQAQPITEPAARQASANAAQQPADNNVTPVAVSTTDTPASTVAGATDAIHNDNANTKSDSAKQQAPVLANAAPQPAQPAPLPAAAPQTPKDTLSVKEALTQQAALAATANAAAANVAQPASGDAKPVVSPASTTATNLAATAAADNSYNGNSGNSDSDDSGQNQQAPGSANVVPQATHQAAPHATTGNFAQALNKAAPLPVAEQIAFQVKTAAATGDSNIRIRLDPADLGKLDIRLNVGTDGKTTLTITADNKNTLNLLQQDTHNLTRALSDAGLKADSGSLNFSLGGGQQQQQQQSQAQANTHAWSSYQKAQPDEDEASSILTTISRSSASAANGALDITI